MVLVNLLPTALTLVLTSPAPRCGVVRMAETGDVASIIVGGVDMASQSIAQSDLHTYNVHILHWRPLVVLM